MTRVDPARATERRTIVKSTRRQARFVAACLTGLSLVACHTQPPSPPPTVGSTTDVPLALTPGRYAIAPELSEIRFLVYRAGPLAALGHNHVVQARQMRGEIWVTPTAADAGMDPDIPLSGLQVDDATARATEGDTFVTMPDAEAIAGTTRNMLGEKVLDATRYPRLQIHSVAVKGTAHQPDVTIRITLHGREQTLTVPVHLNMTPVGLQARAEFEVRQSDYGITPMSVLGGALQVADAVTVKLLLTARLARGLEPS